MQECQFPQAFWHADINLLDHMMLLLAIHRLLEETGEVFVKGAMDLFRQDI